MTARATKLAGAAAIVGGLAIAAAALYASESRYPATVSTTRLLYLRSGETAKRAMLTFDSLASDVYWIRAIQHYGRDKKSSRTADRFELLQPLLDLTTTLDPNFNVAYRFGAFFLSISPPEGPGRADQAIALLEKGLRNNPTRWQYAHDIGFVHYFYTHDYGQAAQWFKRAGDMPHAPQWVRSLAATSLVQGGNLDEAERMLLELKASGERALVGAADHTLAQIAALRAIDELQGKVEAYAKAAGRYPSSWSDLITARLLPGIPGDVTGTAFVYDPATHDVTLSTSSSLAPLPKALVRPRG
jgi:tetratricopeptide (TPR) repeat protein